MESFLPKIVSYHKEVSDQGDSQLFKFDGNIDMKYGKAIRICRAAKGLSQKELAAKAGIGSSHVSLIEAGKRSPSLATVEKLCDALKIHE